MELALERPEPRGKRDATLLWPSTVREGEGRADRTRLGLLLGGPADVEGPGCCPRGSSSKWEDIVESSRPSWLAGESSPCWELEGNCKESVTAFCWSSGPKGPPAPAWEPAGC